MAVARSQVGVDVEIVDPESEIPWNVLHPDEAAMLSRQDEAARAPSFVRLWSLKEAYLKALGLGLSREPASFAIRFAGRDAADVDDPAGPGTRIDARTIWREVDGGTVAISTVLIG
jgi:4'-phosphopantetheinyl transferase